MKNSSNYLPPECEEVSGVIQSITCSSLAEGAIEDVEYEDWTV